MTTSAAVPRGDSATEHISVPLEQGDIHVCQDGPRDAPALLLIHGSAASTTSWDAIVPLLAGTHRVVRLDLLGHGRSAAPEDADYGVPAQGRLAGAVLDRLGVARAVVVGHSSGGYTATALADARPELVAGLSLVNSGPALGAFLAAGSAPAAPTAWPPSDEQLRMLAAGGFRDGFAIPQDMIDELRGIRPHAFAAASAASTAYLAEKPLPDRLAALGKPLQVVFGEQDRRWRASSAADYLAVPGASVHMLSGSGHSPIMEDPAATARLLLPFAASLRAD